MSHFSVWVISKTGKEDLDNILEPYQEYDGQEYLKKYLEFNSITKEEKERYENDGTVKVKLPVCTYESYQSDCIYNQDDWVTAIAKFLLLNPVENSCDDTEETNEESTLETRDSKLINLLKSFETNDYQNRKGAYPKSDIPDFIKVNIVDDVVYVYTEFKSTTEESALNWLKEFLADKELPEGLIIDTTNKRLKRYVDEDEYNEWEGSKGTEWKLSGRRYVYDPSVLSGEKVMVKYKDIYSTFEEFMSDEDFDEEKQDYGYWRNPNSKWDWWVIGGRWNNNIPTLEGINVNQCKISDINFFPKVEDINFHRRYWEVIVDGEPMTEIEKSSERFFNIYKIEYYLERYKTKENYAQISSMAIPFAFIDADGVWYEKGIMGWFGCDSSDENSINSYVDKFNEVMRETNKDYYVTCIDCHI